MRTITARPVATLHIGDYESTVTIRAHGRPQRRILLAVGAQSMVSGHFRHEPPTPLELENAIAAVEDELQRATAAIDADATWQTSDTAIGAWAGLAGVAESAPRVLSLEAVERLFDLLAALVQGRPASSAGIPSDASFAATLLILRECMHHLGVASISIASSRMPDLPGPIHCPMPCPMP